MSKFGSSKRGDFLESEELLLLEIERQQEVGKEVAFRADAYTGNWRQVFALECGGRL